MDLMRIRTTAVPVYQKPVLRMRIQDSVLFCPLDPGSGMNYFRISKKKTFATPFLHGT
jgi:hypothetical protein